MKWSFLVVSLCLLQKNLAVVLDEFSESYLKELIQEFEESPTRNRFRTIVHPLMGQFDEKSGKWKLPPAVFLWSPTQHLGISVMCPEHYVELKLGPWTDDLTNDGRRRNPRLVFCIGGNALLVQRFLICPFNQHQFLSAQAEILFQLPDFVKDALFPFELHHRSAFDKAVVSFLKNSLLSGATFQQVSEQIANNNYEAFARRANYCFLKDKAANSDTYYPRDSLPTFFDNILYSFPSSDKLINLLLGEFNSQITYYRNPVDSKKAKFCLSTDHTFKVGKHIGCFDDVGEFVNQFGKLFIVLNENHEVMGWRLTKTTGHSEVKDLLENIKERIDCSLTYVIVDDCCKEKKLYQSIFGDSVKVKLDLFHAVQRVVRELPEKSDIGSLKFSKEFGLVFRANEDQGCIRTMATPSPAAIKGNLELFLDRYDSFLSSLEITKKCKIMNEITKLRGHIEKGCLSGILPGHGTEHNEMLHSLLNRSLLRGAHTIGPELAIALLYLLFTYYNNKLHGEKHVCNSKITPMIPVLHNKIILSDDHDILKAVQDLPFHIPKETGKTGDTRNGILDEENEQASSSSKISAEVNDAATFINVFGKELIDAVKQLTTLLRNIEQSCVKRDIKIFEMPFFSSTLVGLTSETNVSADHKDRLNRNLSSFGLETEYIEMDGDCAFRCFVVQLRTVMTILEPSAQEEVNNHLQTIGLTQETEEEQIIHLRKIFVDTVLKEEKYKSFVSADDRLTAEEFYKKGMFATGIGDLVMNVLADIFTVPIIVISSSAQHPIIPILPDKPIIDQPLYVALDISSVGHYSATRQINNNDNSYGEIESCDDSPISHVHCKCGKNIPGRPTCIGALKSKCPCVKNKQPCTRKCLCRVCENKSIDTVSKNKKEKGCSCGKNNDANDDAKRCMDGKMKSKCPCLKNRERCCPTLCMCKSCGNIFGSNDKKMSRIKSNSKGNRVKSFKRAKGAEFLKESGYSVIQGSWSGNETVALAVIVRFVSNTSLQPTAENLFHLYNWLAKSLEESQEIPEVRPKSKKQVASKVGYMEKLRNFYLSLSKI